ncbi:MAG: hypothetical protein OXH38_06705, partial [Chloroflexi bacterium]|nr:hypothetical protein [Chloroflexota bacterium]
VPQQGHVRVAAEFLRIAVDSQIHVNFLLVVSGPAAANPELVVGVATPPTGSRRYVDSSPMVLCKARKSKSGQFVRSRLQSGGA